MKRSKHQPSQDEPAAEGDDWVVCGGQRIWAAGFTEAGFPYGLTEEQFRQGSERYDSGAGWARAKRILEEVVRERAAPGAKVAVGYVKKMGGGLSRETYAAEVEIATGAKRHVAEIAALLPRRGCDPGLDDRTRKETRLLGELARSSLPFRVPRVFGVARDGDHLALVRSYERGVELDLRAGRQHGVLPWEVVGKIAAAVHGVGADAFPWVEPRCPTRRGHALAAISDLDDLHEPEFADARAWMLEHLPPPTPSALVHGDLLGQNVLLGLSEPDAVIDWEYAQLGDPAYDLAIVTRGVRRPFQIDSGMKRLLDAYARAGGVEVREAHVRLHELALAARWYRDALSGESRHGSSQHLQFFRSLLRRASAGHPDS